MRRGVLRLHLGLADLDPPGEFRGLEQPPYATLENGLAGPEIELKINSPIFVKHLQDIADLAKEGVFRYGGRTSEAKPLFLSGECGIYHEFLRRPRRRGEIGDQLRHRPAAL